VLLLHRNLDNGEKIVHEDEDISGILVELFNRNNRVNPIDQRTS
jgi:hypothetical protein